MVVTNNLKNGDKAMFEEKMSQFENAKTLLISSKRPKAFLVRTACELLAGGTEVLILSALGDAISLCLQLQMLLTSKSAATTFRIETLLNKTSTDKPRPSFIPGLLIFMKKHPEFRGSRISPGYISFSPEPTNGFTPAYEPTTSEVVCSVDAGDSEFGIGGGGINAHFAEVLSSCGHDVLGYKGLFTNLYNEAVKANSENPDVFVSTVSSDVESCHPDLKFAMCRLPRDRSLFANERDGVVFICVFKDKFPHDNPNNSTLLYVVGPDGSDKSYKLVDKFLEAVHATGENLVTALCDYNGMVKRELSKKLSRIASCRLCLVSGGVFRHPKVTKVDVAKAVIGGIADGYRHGPTPRFKFAYDEDAFRTAWCETTGLKASFSDDTK